MSHCVAIFLFSLCVLAPLVHASDGAAVGAPVVAEVAARWKRIPAFEAKVISSPAIGKVPKNRAETLWDRSAWDATGLGGEAQVSARFRRENFQLVFAPPGTTPSGSQDIAWMSFVAGEFVQVIDPQSAQPHAEIRPGPDANRLGQDKVLTLFEHQLFDIREPWCVLLGKLDFVNTASETIGDHPCLKLENSAETDGRRIEVWVAEDLDYAPVRARHTTHAADFPTAVWEMHVTDHVPVGASWIARSAMLALTRDDISFYQMSAFEIIDLTIGEEFAPKSLRESLSAGTKVTDVVRAERWVADGAGGRDNIEPVDMKQREEVAKALAAQVNRPQMSRARSYGLAGVAGATVAVVLAVILVRRRLGA